MTGTHSDRILARLMTLHPKIIDLTLDRMLPLLAKLDHPEQRLPPVIHVAGTNGKGSLLAYLRAMLEAAGYRVHVYTSPHLVRFAERIRLAGKIIEEDALSQLLLDCEAANGETPITYFEITTIAAFKAFADTPGDILLLETGLGGRYDATNVVACPALTAITPISHDHAEFLGTDLAGIAGEKAGIIKAGAPVVIGLQDPVVLEILQKTAETLGSLSYIYDREWSCHKVAGGWQYDGMNGARVFPMPALHGVHQIENAATAVACLNHLGGFDVPDAAINKGLAAVEWPARMQRLRHGPIVKAFPAHVEVWLDGGHNPAAGEQIAKSFANWNETEPKPTYLIAGMLNTKDQKAFFSKLAPVITTGHCITIPEEAAATPAVDLASMAQAGGLDMTEMPSLMAAVEALKPTLAEKPSRLLIAGSLYLAGQVLRENG
ncbi:folylpolyglutamate synthase/dihydrofolate synthase family protein [Sneathiella sp.]|uniref:bifunctional folylpolyglutamate synthase/dihydrofolate synthase n=1 Tax=Sneathiella sp. TaxID=1964365 RepID=UPI00261D526D|nr:folylpolyglutamate synthase/dihydrofolate synthase family protein [Sneathiella sp.]MDF2368531.1 bifunctional folylpolyglutamate synthase/dihydrofolate synthase [Sneathiella sp.]